MGQESVQNCTRPESCSNTTSSELWTPQLTVVFDEAQLPEFVHEGAHARAGRPDHLGERLLTDLRRDQFRRALLTDIPQEQEKACEALLAGVEQLIDQVLFDPAVAANQIEACFARLVEAGFMSLGSEVDEAGNLAFTGLSTTVVILWGQSRATKITAARARRLSEWRNE